jgi:uncharacterized membrane protein YgdD (TMEM256/DUF423 family)
MTIKSFCVLASSVFGATAVIGGAFAAHALRDLSQERLAVLKTAMQYQLVHAVVLLVLAQLSRNSKSRALAVAGICFAAGVVLFSGSLSLVALAGWRAAGAIAPLGGSALIAGWISLGFLARERP